MVNRLRSDLKITHIINSLGTGGAEGALFRLIKHSSNPHNHTVITLLDEGPYKEKLEELGVTVISLNIKSFLAFFYILKLYVVLLNRRDSIVQTWLYHSDLIGGLLTRLTFNSKLIWTIRNTTVHNNSKLTKYIQNLCSIMSAYLPQKIVSCSHVAKEYHYKLGYCKEIHVIPNGYDFAVLKQAREQREEYTLKLGLSDRSYVIGCVARFDEQKDHVTLFKSFSKALKSELIPPDSILVLAGTGMTRDNSLLRKLLVRYEIDESVMLCGPRTDILSVICCFDVSILTSLSEAFPNVLAESMGLGVPCIATDVGDSSIIVGENGWISSPKDIDSIARNIINSFILCKNDNLRITLNQKCIAATVSRYSIESMVGSFESLWSDF